MTTKFLGAYDPVGGIDPPAWMTWGKVPAWKSHRRLDMFRQAAELASRRPFWFVVHLGKVGDSTVETDAPAVLNDILDAGLWPHVRGVEFGDEILSSAYNGAFDWLGPQATTLDGQWRRLEAAATWARDEYAALDELFPKRWLRLWSEICWNEQRAYGPAWWRPCPPSVNLIQITSYNLALLPTLIDVAAQGQPRDLIVTPQWYTSPGTGPVPSESIALYPRLLAHPRVRGACGYYWHSDPDVPAGWRGLEDMPEMWDAVSASWGVK